MRVFVSPGIGQTIFQPASGPSVAQDGSAVAGLVHTGTTNSQTITVGVNVNKAIIALIGNDNSFTVSAVDYTAGSGGAFVKLGSVASANFELEIWSSVAPAAGSTTVRATYSGTITQDAMLLLHSLYNVDQATPVDGYAVNAADTNSVSTTLSSGGLVLGCAVKSPNPDPIVSGTQDYSDAFNANWRAAYNSASGTIGWTTNTPLINLCNVRKA